jgi:hypothetical protein
MTAFVRRDVGGVVDDISAIAALGKAVGYVEAKDNRVMKREAEEHIFLGQLGISCIPE